MIQSVILSLLKLVRYISNIYTYLRILSIDVALGGVIFSNSLAYAFDNTIPYSVSLALFISIWLIYTLDHFLDARKLKDEPSMKRHAFHKKYKKVILIIMGLMTIGGICTLFFLPFTTLIYGCVVVLIVSIYFFLSWKLKIVLIKEVLIASVYATGIFLAPISLFEIDMTLLMFLLSQVFGLALINLLLFSYFEMEFDKSDGCHSWATKFGLTATKKHIAILFVLQIFLHVMALIYVDYTLVVFVILLLSMTLILLVIFIVPDFFLKNERYRFFGDLVFFIPVLIYWL